MAKRKTRPAEPDRTDRFYESLASIHTGFVDTWPETSDTAVPEFDNLTRSSLEYDAKVTAIITLILAFVVTLVLAVVFSSGVSTIQNALAPAPAPVTTIAH